MHKIIFVLHEFQYYAAPLKLIFERMEMKSLTLTPNFKPANDVVIGFKQSKKL